ncbi:alpha/beta hydrolase [Amycolatopsis alba]|uniref:Alpha/beta hydrolase n=1 Tax=Amycolatopsis alba DSM 44262 TaxID=1125972 RepID=A0A229S223_AMYAL|nr:alpha/beta hydrolase [Amycolatopsis alba]OXM52967.1 alpha/beta hydrolase [Amycolatopsis alba DSM 44262]
MTKRRRTLAAGLTIALLASLAQSQPAAGAQRIGWHDCRTGPDDATGQLLAAAGATCGEVTVPLDHADPGGRTLSVAVARRAATDPARRLGTLMVNTGGPGPSREGVALLAQGLPPEVPSGAPSLAARYDLVGIDPRFFGLSAPLECGWPTGRYLQSAQLASPDRASFERGVAVARDLAARCVGQGDLLAHASTRDIARDMDLVRAALGEPKISYLGWSFGSHLGAVYRQLFPRRVERIVLDSAAAPGAAGPALTRETAPADAAALRDWARWAAVRDGRYHLGATADEVLAGVDRIAREPLLLVGGHRVDAAMIPGLLLTVDDSDAFYAEFSAQVVVLRDAARGLAVTPTPTQEWKLSLYTDPKVEPAFGFSATVANQCADRAASRDPESYYRDIQAHRAAEPLFGPLARHITPCAFWPVRPAETPVVIGNDLPALLVGASGDPVTPYAGQRALRRALPGSRMVTLDGAFRHGVYLFDTAPCVTEVVESYLLGGPLPRTDVTCARHRSPGRTTPAS